MALPLSAESKASLERPCSARDLSSLRIKSGAPVGLNVPQCADIWKTLSRSASWSSPGVQLLGITCAIWPSRFPAVQVPAARLPSNRPMNHRAGCTQARAREPTTNEAPNIPSWPGNRARDPTPWQVGRQTLDGRRRSSEQQILVHRRPKGSGGTVKLRRSSQNTGARRLSSCGVGRAAPLRGCFGSENPKRRPGDEMALEVEGIVDGAQKALRRCR
jgi:hypothetical protein